MKRYCLFILVLSLLFCTAGCSSPAHGETSTLPKSTPSAEISDVASPLPEYDWGITLTLDNLTRTGATIGCTQSGGESVSELNTGSFFILEQLTERGWVEVEQRKLEGDLAWTMEAYIVNLNGTTQWDLSWEWLYGELPDGHYRVGKEFMNFRGPGDYDTMMVYAEFSFGQMPIAE